MAVIEPNVALVLALPASDEDITAVHAAQHIAWVKQLGVYAIAALAAGAAIQAELLGITEPCFALIRPPGYHASPTSAWGFCYLSNMAIAMKHLLSNGQIQRGQVLDIDLHFGDGTVNALQNTPEVTVHNPDESDRVAYLSVVAKTLDRCEADVIGISAGFDNYPATIIARSATWFEKRWLSAVAVVLRCWRAAITTTS